MPHTVYWRAKLLTALCGGTATPSMSTVYCGLLQDYDAETETIGSGYSRVAMTSASSWTAGTTSATNANAITFTPTGVWPDVVGFGIWDAATAGNLMTKFYLNTPKTGVDVGSPVEIPIGGMILEE